ncbi:hypothetical protein TGP89_365700 [Toxoplasma gondii p89]|uniref:Uncharacterized protein n=1 Tax=Toxoplasma gondii p89 TaxID=943119 RepID=A0A086KAY3_TOXGO|nr:hypothetical protein TGP89_365700 [Toxoplasma gondii p89]
MFLADTSAATQSTTHPVRTPSRCAGLFETPFSVFVCLLLSFSLSFPSALRSRQSENGWLLATREGEPTKICARRLLKFSRAPCSLPPFLLPLPFPCKRRQRLSVSRNSVLPPTCYRPLSTSFLGGTERFGSCETLSGLRASYLPCAASSEVPVRLS